MWKQNLKQRMSEDPLTALLVGSLVASSAAKMINSVSSAVGRRAYAKQVNHSIKRRR